MKSLPIRQCLNRLGFISIDRVNYVYKALGLVVKIVDGLQLEIYKGENLTSLKTIQDLEDYIYTDVDLDVD